MIAALFLLATAPQTQADLNARAGGDFDWADAAMNAQYRATMAAMRGRDGPPVPTRRTGPSFANALLQSQRAWLAYRDAQCTAEGYQFFGGSAQGMAVTGCRAELTRQRTGQLQAMGDSGAR